MTELLPAARQLIEKARADEEPLLADRARVKRALFAKLSASGAAAVAAHSVTAHSTAAHTVTAHTVTAHSTAAHSAGTATAESLGASSAPTLAGTGSVATSGTSKLAGLGLSALKGLGLGKSLLLFGVTTTVATAGYLGFSQSVQNSDRQPVVISASSPIASSPASPAQTPVTESRRHAKKNLPQRSTRNASPATAPPATTPSRKPRTSTPKSQSLRDPNLSSKNTPTAHPSATPIHPQSLSREMKTLTQARIYLRDGDPAAALDLLDTTRAGTLLQAERSATRIFALCQLGRKTEAQPLARQFLERFPRSPFAPRVEQSCAAPSLPNAR